MTAKPSPKGVGGRAQSYHLRVTVLAEFFVTTFGTLLLWGGFAALVGAAIGYLLIGGWSATIIAAGIGLVAGGVIDLVRADTLDR